MNSLPFADFGFAVYLSVFNIFFCSLTSPCDGFVPPGAVLSSLYGRFLEDEEAAAAEPRNCLIYVPEGGQAKVEAGRSLGTDPP
jgi:hypothetical protein